VNKLKNETLDQERQKDNLLFLRRYLRMTQKNFIKQYLSDENGEALISISTLSNLESKGGARLDNVINTVAEKLNIDPPAFNIHPDNFVKNIDVFLRETDEGPSMSEVPLGTKSNVGILIHELTNYFADQIFTGKLRPGDKIESDRALAKKFNVGRTAIRETLKVLNVLGLIDIRPGQGSFICKDGSNFFIIPLSWSIFLDSEKIDSILVVRDMLEIKAAELAAISAADGEHLYDLTNVSYAMHTAYVEQNFRDFLDLDLKFHEAVSRCSKNSIIFNLSKTISNLIRRVSSSGMVNIEQLTHIYNEHQQIYGFIIAHDSVAAGEAMKKHLEQSRQRYDYDL
jgi:DNA-binding FadR family transcriptional regulator